MKKKLNLLWITDDWNTLDRKNDTTLFLMEAAKKNEIKQKRLSLKELSLSQHQTLRTQNYSHVFYRVDPPVNTSYLLGLQLLNALIDPKKTECVNPLSTLAIESEKLIPFLRPELTPPTLITSNYQEAHLFYKKHKKVILKPLNGAQSKGISLPSHEIEFKKTFQKLTFTPSEYDFSPCLIQKFLPEIAEGEKRLWFCDGRLMSYGQKVPKKGEHIINMDQGGTLKLCPLTLKEKRAIPKISKILNQLKIRWAAVDLIEGLITDFNHTSPGLIKQLEKLHGDSLSEKLILKTIL